MISASTNVDGRRTHYAIGGRGLPVLFLHGWGLDHRAYARSLRRLTARNCRVIAPSLPGFGGTDGLPVHDQSVRAFGRWVATFLDAIGVDGPVVVMGHSFGGGIATSFADDHPDRVRHLVILNAVGDPDAMGWGLGRGSVFDLARAALDPVRDLVAPTERGAQVRHAQRRFVENALRDPLRVAGTALVAATADTRAEMASLAARRLPVSVLWSDQDGVIPMRAFDTFCSTFGTEGHVLPGGHSWLLTRPDAFGAILENVLRVQAESHRAETTSTTTAELIDLLRATSMPPRTIASLMNGVSSLWLLSAPANVLAADLALCHPRIRAGEVRAVARATRDPDTYRLAVAAPDRAGLLADTVAVLTNEGLSVQSASAATWPDLDLALHAVTVQSDAPVEPGRWEAIGERLTAAADGDVAVPDFTPADRTEVSVLGDSGDSTFVRVTSPDRRGLLAAICRWFATAGLSIESADISTEGGMASDVFLVTGECDVDALATHLGSAQPGTFSRALRSLRIA